MDSRTYQDLRDDGIQDDDLVGSRINSRKKVRRARNGTIETTSLMPPAKSDEPRISVDLLSRGDLRHVAQCALETGGSFYGWATIIVSQARQDRRTVEWSPIDENLYHTDLTYPVADRTCLRDFYAKRLAAQAEWQDNPENTLPLG